MEATYKSLDNRTIIKFNGTDSKDLFEQMAKFSEIFETNVNCGHCQSDQTRFSVREVDSNKYYERKCNKCGYSFQFGQHKKGGTLFPKWDKGWTKWQPSEQDKEHDKRAKEISGKKSK